MFFLQYPIGFPSPPTKTIIKLFHALSQFLFLKLKKNVNFEYGCV